MFNNSVTVFIRKSLSVKVVRCLLQESKTYVMNKKELVKCFVLKFGRFSETWLCSRFVMINLPVDKYNNMCKFTYSFIHQNKSDIISSYLLHIKKHQKSMRTVMIVLRWVLWNCGIVVLYQFSLSYWLLLTVIWIVM